MIDAFEILRNSELSGYHNGTTMNFEIGAERRFNLSETAKTWSFWSDAAQACDYYGYCRGVTSRRSTIGASHD
jgi:hypothetical protein